MKRVFFIFWRKPQLLLVVLALLGSSLACTSFFSSFLQSDRPDFKPKIGGSREVVSGSQVTRELSVSGEPAGPVTYMWNPDSRISGIQFSGAQPEPGGPPYIFKDVPAGQNVPIQYQAPVESGSGTYIYEMVEAKAGDWVEYSLADTWVNPGQSGSAFQPISYRRTEPWPAAQNAAYNYYQLETWTGFQGMTLDTPTCQKWAGYLKNEQVFMALDFPLPADTSNGIRLPLMVGRDMAPQAALQSLKQSGKSLIEGPLLILPERMGLVNQLLPAEEGRRWMALGLDPAQDLTCPDGLNLSGEEWEMYLKMTLDLDEGMGQFDQEVLKLYVCYAGQDSPLSALPVLSGRGSLQQNGITCAGPYAVPLAGEETRPLLISHNASLWVPKPGQVLIRHFVTASHAVTAQLSVGSTRNLPARFYSGSESAPNLNAPLDAITVSPGQRKVLWLVVDVPEGQASGLETLTITAADGTDSIWTNDVLWIGEWQAPPLPTPTPQPTATPEPTAEPTLVPTAAPTMAPTRAIETTSVPAATTAPTAAPKTAPGGICGAAPLALVLGLGSLTWRKRRRHA